MVRPLVASFLLLAAISLRGFAAEHRVASAAELAALADALKPGDVVLMAEGVWQDEKLVFQPRGTAAQPITLRAATPGKTVLTGASSLAIDGEHLVVSGLLFKDTAAAKETIEIKGRDCRLTDCAIVGGTSKFFVRVFGAANRVDHCYLAGKTSESPTLQIEAEGQPNGHRIDHNHFGPRPPLGRNGGETIRVGYSGQSMSASGTIVERNLFEKCDGELEIISNKSCENIYRGNTFLECAGTLTLRHGNRCVVDGNFFLGRHKRGAGGIRVIGEDHTIINNYMEGLETGGFWITSGIPDSPLVGYFQARNCTIAFNTIVDSAGACLDLSAGIGTSKRTLLPENITIANNLFAVAESGILCKGQESESYRWLGNLVTAGSEMAKRDGVQALDLRMMRAADGLWRPAAESPARGAAEGKLSAVVSDIDGQARTGRFDIGCDQASDAAITSRPLTAIDVGPGWMKRGELTGL